MSLTERLSEAAGAAFAAEGLGSAFGKVQRSDRPDLGQFQCNGALAAAKAAKTNPRAIGEAVAARLRANPIFAEVSLAGPGFINLTLDDAFLSEALRALAADPRHGAAPSPAPEKLVIDYGGPNVAKPLHVGHLRSAIIGEALKRLARFAGHEVVADVHLGDWGLQMGQLISELELERPDLPYFTEGATGPFPESPPVTLADLEALYPRASAACKADPARMDLARKATVALQAGRAGYRALWRHFVDLSVAAIRREYDDLNVAFDLWKGEADADPLIADVAADLEAKGLLEDSDGARVIRVARASDRKEMPPIIFRNSEGAAGYHATDIATILDRVRGLGPDRIWYVVDQRQALHFEQVFRAAGLLGYAPEDRLEHLGFGTMNGTDGKPFKTRAGGVLKLRDLIDMVEGKARERLSESGLADGFAADEAAKVARDVGVAALKFADLMNPRMTDYVFDIDRFMAFEGKTGPYLLYAVVRIKSVLRRLDFAPDPATIRISDPAERDLALTLAGFADAAAGAFEKRAPHILCEHAFSTAQAFSRFYAACRIADEADSGLQASRAALADAALRQISLCLEILGIPAPDRM